MTAYAEHRHWSVRHDAEMVRISVFNAHGHEFHMTIPGTGVPNYRTRRGEAIDRLEHAMAAGDAPGEVRE